MIDVFSSDDDDFASTAGWGTALIGFMSPSDEFVGPALRPEELHYQQLAKDSNSCGCPSLPMVTRTQRFGSRARWDPAQRRRFRRYQSARSGNAAATSRVSPGSRSRSNSRARPDSMSSMNFIDPSRRPSRGRE